MMHANARCRAVCHQNWGVQKGGCSMAKLWKCKSFFNARSFACTKISTLKNKGIVVVFFFIFVQNARLGQCQRWNPGGTAFLDMGSYTEHEKSSTSNSEIQSSTFSNSIASLVHCCFFFDVVYFVAIFPMDLAYMCVKPQMRLYVCQTLPLPNTKCVYMCVTKCVYMCVTKCVYMCVTKCVYMCVTKCVLHVCHQMCLLTQRSSLRSLTFARFARTFFNSLNWNSCLKTILV